MPIRTTLALSAVLCLAAAAPLVAQVSEASEIQVRALLVSNGYTGIESLAFEDGLWGASADAPDGGRVTVHVHPASDRVYRADATPTIEADTLTERLAEIGWVDVHSPRFEDGVWKVEAENDAGQELLLYLDPDNGALLGSHGD